MGLYLYFRQYSNIVHHRQKKRSLRYVSRKICIDDFNSISSSFFFSSMISIFENAAENRARQTARSEKLFDKSYFAKFESFSFFEARINTRDTRSIIFNPWRGTKFERNAQGRRDISH